MPGKVVLLDMMEEVRVRVQGVVQGVAPSGVSWELKSDNFDTYLKLNLYMNTESFR